jgi:hypothetical protein
MSGGIGLRQREDVADGVWSPDGVGRELAEAADALAVEGELVGAFDGRDVDGERAGDVGDVDLAAVPGEAGVAGVGLGSPGLVGGDLLPGGVVEGRGEPAGVVAEVEAPVAGGREDAFAGVGGGERLGVGGRGCGEAEDEEQPERLYARGLVSKQDVRGPVDRVARLAVSFWWLVISD